MKKAILISLIAVFLTGCIQNGEKEEIITVSGKIPTEQLGTALIHEHVMVDWIGADSTGSHRWDRSDVVERAFPFLKKAKEHGVSAFFDCTPVYLGRDPLILKELSKRTGMHIVTNTGYYGAVDNRFIPKHACEDEAEEIARVWIDEFENGIEGSDVHPGFIKIGVARQDTLSPMHKKLIEAAAITHKATGLPVVSHTGPDGPAFAQMGVLKEEGVSPEAFIWTHAQQGTLEGYIQAANQGAWISLDNLKSKPSNDPEQSGNIDWYVDTLTKLKREGILNKILISHDSGWYSVGEEQGGNYRGYTDIFEYLIPALKDNGFTQEDIDLLLVKNPQRAYAVKVRTN